MTRKDDVKTVCAWAPASLSNLGPGFDTLGVALAGIGDRVTVRRTRSESIVVIVDGPSKIPTEPRSNTASVAGLKVLELAGVEGGLRVELEKGIPFGSGLGGSAASAAAGALATNALVGFPLDEAGLAEATLAGETVASGSTHGDNAIPSLVGGVILVDAANPATYRRVQPGTEIFFAIVVPDLHVETSIARRMLPAEVALADAVHSASSLAWLMESIRDGDIDLLGRMIMRDVIVEPIRAAMIPCYDVIKTAALESGAPGCALSGSGPAIFAVSGDAEQAERVTAAMDQACRGAGFGCLSLTSTVDPAGARIEESNQ